MSEVVVPPREMQILRQQVQDVRLRYALRPGTWRDEHVKQGRHPVSGRCG